MSEVINALTAIQNKSESRKDKKMPSKGKEGKQAIWGQTGLKRARTQKKERKEGREENERREKKSGNSKKDHFALPSDLFRARAHISESIRRPNAY